MPATVTLDPLGVYCIFSDGSEYRRRLRVRRPVELPGLARTLLEGATDLVHPHGQVDSVGGFDLYLTAVRGFTDWLVEFGFSGGASDLTRAPRPVLAARGAILPGERAAGDVALRG